jgi:hypothetical protein
LTCGVFVADQTTALDPGGAVVVPVVGAVAAPATDSPADTIPITTTVTSTAWTVVAFVSYIAHSDHAREA